MMGGWTTARTGKRMGLRAGRRAVAAIGCVVMLAGCTEEERAPAGSPTTTPTATGSPSPTPTPTTRPVFAVPASIRADCSADVTAKLLAWIGSVPDGSTLTFARKACYRIDGTLRIAGRTDLRFEGNRATFRAVRRGGRTRHHWWIVGGRDITLRNMTIRGANPNAGSSNRCFDSAHEHQHGVALWGVQGALLESLRIFDVYGDSVYFGNTGTEPNRNVTVRGGQFERNGRQGFGIVHAENITLDRNELRGICMTVFDLEPEPETHLRGITITNNTVGEHRHLFLANSGSEVETSNVFVAHNRVLGRRGMRWPFGPGSANPTINVGTPGSRGWVIRNNDFARFEGTALRFVGASGVTITCNRVRWISMTGTGVELRTVRTATIRNDRFVGGSTAVTRTNSTGVRASGNTLDYDPFPASCGTIGPLPK
jgi:hypothetical protein